MPTENFSLRSEHRSSCATVSFYGQIFESFAFWRQIQGDNGIFRDFFVLQCDSIDFPPEVVRGESLFTNMVIDETTSQSSNNCDDVFVYITDTVEPGKNLFYGANDA